MIINAVFMPNTNNETCRSVEPLGAMTASKNAEKVTQKYTSLLKSLFISVPG